MNYSKVLVHMSIMMMVISSAVQAKDESPVLELDSLFANIAVADISGFPELALFVTVLENGQSEGLCKSAAFSLEESPRGSGETRPAEDLEVSFLPELGPSAVSVVLVMDTSESLLDANGIQQARDAALEFVAQLQPQDRAAIVVFSSNDRVGVLQPFTNDRSLLKSAIVDVTAAGYTALYDGVLAGLEEASREPGNRNVIVFTDGVENDSLATFEDMENEARRLVIPVHTIAVGDAEDSDLQNIALRTNGTFRKGELGQLGSLYVELTRQIRSQYRLVLTAPYPDSGGRSRELKLKLKCGGLETFANTTYSPVIPLNFQPMADTNTLMRDGSVEPGAALHISFEVLGDPTDVRLLYRRTGTEAFQELPMVAADQNILSASLPPEAVQEPGVDFYLIAFRGGVTRSYPLAAHEPALRSPQVAVGTVLRPELTHGTPEATVGRPIILPVQISSSSDVVRSATLFYRLVGKREYEVEQLDVVSGNQFTAMIPALFSAQQGVEYVIMATSEAGLHGWLGRSGRTSVAAARATATATTTPAMLVRCRLCSLGTAHDAGALGIDALLVADQPAANLMAQALRLLDILRQ